MKRLSHSIVTFLFGATLALAVAGSPALAQQSAHFRIKTPVLNAGGRPLDGSSPSSGTYLLRPEAIGESAVDASASSVSFRLAGGFLQAFPAPGEVDALVFNNSTTLAWAAEPFAGTYNLYRAGPMGTGTGVAPVGNCLQPNVTGLMAADPAAPLPGRAYFYFVNAVNCTRIEGPAGTIGARCP